MKRKLQITLAALALTACTATAQTLTITGYIQNAPGPVEVTIAYLEGFLFNDVTTVMTDENGVFTYTDSTVTLTGLFMIYYECEGIVVSAEDTWNEDTMNFAITMTYCGGGTNDCNAYFYFVDDSLGNNLFNVTVVNISTGTDLSYIWDFGDGGTSDEMNPTYYYAVTGSYLLCLTVSDGEGCTSTFCDSLTVNEDGTWDGGDVAQIGFTLNVISEEELNAVSENELVFEAISVFPNPITESSTLTIETKQAFTATLECTDVMGQLISNYSIVLTKGKNVVPLNIEIQSSGTYLISVRNEIGFARTIKLLK